MRNLEKQHKTSPIHSYALARPVQNPIKANPSQLSITRTTAVKSSYQPLAAHCQPNPASCRKLLRQSEVPRYRKIVLTNEKHLKLHRSASCCWGRGWLAVPFWPTLNDYHFLLQHVFQSNLQVSSKGEGKSKPSDSKILWDKRVWRNLVISGAIQWNGYWDAVAYLQGSKRSCYMKFSQQGNKIQEHGHITHANWHVTFFSHI